MSEMGESSADSGSTDALTGTDQPSTADGLTASAPEQPLPEAPELAPPENASAPEGGGPPSADDMGAGPPELALPGKATVPAPARGAAQVATGPTASPPKPALPGKATVPAPARGAAQVATGPTASPPKPALPGKATVPAPARGAPSATPEPSAMLTSLTPGAEVEKPGSPTLGGETEPRERPTGEPPAPPDPADEMHLHRLSAPREQSESAPGVKADSPPRFDVAAAFRNLQNRASDAAYTPHADPPGMLHEAQERWLRDAKPDALADAILNRDKSAAGRADPPTSTAPATAPTANAPGAALDNGNAAAAPRVNSVDRHSSGGWLVTFDRPMTVEQTEQLLWPGGVPDAVQVLSNAPEKIQFSGLNDEAVERMAPEALDRLCSLRGAPAGRAPA